MKISLIVPVYNEEETIPLFYEELTKQAFFSKNDVEIVFINDGSRDRTELVAREVLKNYSKAKLLNFSRNFGKEAALFAGLNNCSGDVIIPIDVDLQDPLEVIEELLKKYKEGAEVVLAKRVCRGTDSYLKRKTASLFYSIYNKASNPKIEENVGDFRLLSKKVVKHIKELPEKNLFMKGILGWPGFKTEIVTYRRASRVAGKTKFNGWKLWNLALDGITSFSTLPLRIWTYLGATIAFISIFYAFVLIAKKIFLGNPVPGYPSLMVAILFLGGVQLIGIGVLGEYLGRMYIEVKNRPRYIIRDSDEE